MMGALVDITGQRFGRLTAIKRIGTKQRSVLWLCECDCGNLFHAVARSLRSGNTKSCGCIHSEQLAKRNYENRIHGDVDSRLYGIWHGMKQRCCDPKRKDYKNYGGRGITICDEWVSDYAAFQEWALKTGYDYNAGYMQCTLDRIDTDGPYAPWNCRWVDAKTQANNRKNENVRRNANGTYKRAN
jgi:hypothetical protein